MKRILVTGGAGFIGSNFILYLMRSRSDIEIWNLDNLTYAGNLANLKEVEALPRYRFIKGDIADSAVVRDVVKEGVQGIVNFAAESHVDRSIEDAGVFLRTNVMGTQTLLDAARDFGVEKFVQVSTDEVYGSLGPKGAFSETSPLKPNSPYAASKAAADLLVRAYHKTYGLPVAITRCSNNYGPYQFPEKLIPLFITNALENKQLPLYGDGLNVRDWIHVEDHCRAIGCVLDKGKVGEVYNIGADSESTNKEITYLILKKLGRDESLIRYVKDRLGHDRRYAIDPEKIRGELGWSPIVSFNEGIGQTIQWYRDNETWWREIKDGEYLKYYERVYGDRGV